MCVKMSRLANQKKTWKEFCSLFLLFFYLGLFNNAIFELNGTSSKCSEIQYMYNSFLKYRSMIKLKIVLYMYNLKCIWIKNYVYTDYSYISHFDILHLVFNVDYKIENKPVAYTWRIYIFLSDIDRAGHKHGLMMQRICMYIYCTKSTPTSVVSSNKSHIFLPIQCNRCQKGLKW